MYFVSMRLSLELYDSLQAFNKGLLQKVEYFTPSKIRCRSTIRAFFIMARKTKRKIQAEISYIHIRIQDDLFPTIRLFERYGVKYSNKGAAPDIPESVGS